MTHFEIIKQNRLTEINTRLRVELVDGWVRVTSVNRGLSIDELTQMLNIIGFEFKRIANEEMYHPINDMNVAYVYVIEKMQVW